MKSTRAVLAATAALGLAAVGPASVASNPHSVDPAFVTPALNPAFAPYACWETGQQIICEGGTEASYDDTTDIPCAGGFVHVVGAEKVSITRRSDLDGRALEAWLHTAYDDRLSLTTDPDSPYVQLYAHWQKHYVYPVPGDATQRVLRESGAIMRVRGATGGIVFQDTGNVEYVPDQEYEGVASMHGVHDRFGGPDMYEAICEALLSQE